MLQNCFERTHIGNLNLIESHVGIEWVIKP